MIRIISSQSNQSLTCIFVFRFRFVMYIHSFKWERGWGRSLSSSPRMTLGPFTHEGVLQRYTPNANFIGMCGWVHQMGGVGFTPHTHISRYMSISPLLSLLIFSQPLDLGQKYCTIKIKLWLLNVLLCVLFDIWLVCIRQVYSQYEPPGLSSRFTRAS